VFIATPPHCSSGSFFFKSITIGVPWLCLCSASVSVCQWMDCQPVRLAYQPPANSTFLSEQTSH
jgi:hypothetical protein